MYSHLLIQLVSHQTFSDKAGPFLLLVLSPYMEDLQTLQKWAGKINTLETPDLAIKTMLHFCQNHI